MSKKSINQSVGLGLDCCGCVNITRFVETITTVERPE